MSEADSGSVSGPMLKSIIVSSTGSSSLTNLASKMSVISDSLLDNSRKEVLASWSCAALITTLPADTRDLSGITQVDSPLHSPSIW